MARNQYATREPLGINSFWITLCCYMLIGLAALAPRMVGLGSFITFDEASFWIQRSQKFLHAIQHGDFAAIPISSHPGITTMWLGSMGILLYDLLKDWELLLVYTIPTQLGIMQLCVVLPHTAGILLGYRLLRRMADTHTALVAGLLWAFDPFVIGYSRVLHVDALAGTFCTLSILAACCYWFHTPRWHLLIGSGVCAGLAVLSKTPALILVPLILLIAYISKQQLRRSMLAIVVWSAAVASTLVCLWPALWAAPQQVFALLRVGVEIQGMNPHERGNFFLGQRDDAPGLLFYPVALALRTTPITLIGLLLLPLVVSLIASRDGTTDRPTNIELRDLVALLVFIIAFIAAMSLFEKKFNRYLVPIFPALDILAAYGLVSLLQRMRHQSANLFRTWRACFVLLIGSLAALNAGWWHPYGITAFNQLLGGAPVGARAFMTGWGEGSEQVATWLNTQPDITGVLVASNRTEPIQYYLRQGAQATSPSSDQFPAQTGYVVVYVRDIQNGLAWPPFDQFYPKTSPAHVVKIHDVEYAWIYQMPSKVPQPIAAQFGENVRLRGLKIIGVPAIGQQTNIHLFWYLENKPTRHYTMFAHLLAVDGTRYAQVDLPLPLQDWDAKRYYTTEFPLALPSELAVGTYYVVIGLYDQETGYRLPLHNYAAAESITSGSDSLLLMSFQLK
jgi:Dolichyl-phosphate-mannose-protein mannosyltransferase